MDVAKFFQNIDITPYNDAKFYIDTVMTSNDNIIRVTLNTTIETQDFIKRNKKTIIYNEETKEIVNLESYLTSEDKIQIISNLSYHYVLSYLVNNNITIDENNIKKSINNFENYQFTDVGLEITFILIDDIDQEITITIPYAEINYILKEQYKRPIHEQYQRDLTQFKNKKLIQSGGL